MALSDRKLRDYPCPICKTLIKGILVKEEDILGSKRSPVLVPVKCPGKHDVALYVDRRFMIRDAEPLIDPKRSGRMRKAREWLSAL